MKIVIGKREFRSQEAALKYFSALRDQYIPGGRVTDPEHVEELRELLNRHPEAQEKIGCGIDGFCVGPDGVGSHCFHVRRKNGTTVSFSFRTCITGKRKSTETLINDAMRYEVRNAIIRAKQEWFIRQIDPRCQLTGAPIDFDNCDIDHVPPWTFKVLAETFLSARGILPSFGMVERIDCGCRLADRWLAEDWKRHHNRLAVLRVISNPEHKRQTAAFKYPVGITLAVPSNDQPLMVRVLTLLAA